MAVLVRGETTDALNSSPLWPSRSDFSDNSFDSVRIFLAALAALLGLLVLLISSFNP